MSWQNRFKAFIKEPQNIILIVLFVLLSFLTLLPLVSLIRDTLELAEGDALVPFSAEKGTGKEELIGLLNAACEE